MVPAMAKTKVRKGDWVVVCDGRKALIFENVGDEKFLNLQVKEVREHEDPMTHELGTDEPGRVFQSVGTKRSAVEQTDWHASEQRRFLKALVRDLEGALAHKAVERLILVAPPAALGVLRPAYTEVLRRALAAEIAKDWVRMPVPDIEKRLAR